jgi:hypothetical protein
MALVIEKGHAQILKIQRFEIPVLLEWAPMKKISQSI